MKKGKISNFFAFICFGNGAGAWFSWVYLS